MIRSDQIPKLGSSFTVIHTCFIQELDESKRGNLLSFGMFVPKVKSSIEMAPRFQGVVHLGEKIADHSCY